MNTLSEMRNKLFNLYKDALVEYPLLENEEYEEDEKRREKRLHYLCNKIMELDSKEQDNLLSLMALYYYCISVVPNQVEKAIDNAMTETLTEEIDEFIDEIELYNVDDSNYPEDEEDENYEEDLESLIETHNKEEILTSIKESSDSYLYILLDIIFCEDIGLYDYEDDEKDCIDDFDEYEIMENALSDETAKQIFEKLHPNLNLELNHYNDFVNNEKYIENSENLTINSLGEFLKSFMQAKQVLTTDSYIMIFLTEQLQKLQGTNEELYKEIIIFMLKYYYIKTYLNDIDNMQTVIQGIVYTIEDLNKCENMDISYIYENFINFDLNKFYNEFSKLPKKVIDDFTDLISIENTKVYGTDGIWKEYNKLEDYDIIFKRCNYWKYKIQDSIKEKNKCFIYWSVNKEGEYKIPRLLITVNENHEVVQIFGIDSNETIEFEMIDTLDEKLKQYSNYDNFKSDVFEINLISKINEKIDNNIDLNKYEIDFLYGINYEHKDYLFGRKDTRLAKIRDKSDIKKDLATYFDCNIENVSFGNEVDENTVVATELFTNETTCNYKNLKYVFGTLFANHLYDAEGLSNLRYVKGNAYFELLKTSKGLENLVRVDGSIICMSLKDKSYLNPNLIVKGRKRISPDENKKLILK